MTGAGGKPSRFMDLSTSLAVLTVTAAGVLEAVTRKVPPTGSVLAATLALAAAHAALGTVVLGRLEQRADARLIRAHMALATAVALLFVVVTEGRGSLLTMSLISQGVLFLGPWGSGLVVLTCSLTTLLARAPSGSFAHFASYLAAVAFVVVFSRMMLARQRARDEVARLALELRDANERLRASAVSVEELAVAKERNRIAREIHDGLGHYLSAAHVQLEAAATTLLTDPGAAQRSIEKAQGLIHEGLSEVRHSVATLREEANQGRSLLELLGTLVNDDEGVRLRTHGTPRPLSAAVAFTLYRAAQEALTNARRHAAASRVVVSVVFDEERVRLEVQDDGVGAEDPKEGFGLLGLRERATLLGGALFVRTARGAGFKLAVEVPG
jgi:signal transduction histidine kinase